MGKDLNRSNGRLLTTQAAANFIGFKPGTLSNWRASCEGKGPKYIKAASKVFYDEADLIQWLEDQKINPAKRK